MKEFAEQFFSTLIMFCSVIVVSQLVRLSDVLIAFGISPENLLLPFLYIIIPFLPVIVPIATAFSAMVVFNRLSLEGELNALFACGYSLIRLLRPFLFFCSIIWILTTLCAAHLEAWGRREFVQFIYRKTQTELDNIIKFKIQPKVFLPDFLGYVLYTEEISSDRKHFRNVMLAPSVNGFSGDFALFAPQASIKGSVENGDLNMSFFRGVSISSSDIKNTSLVKFKTASVDLLGLFQEKILGADSAKDDYRSFSFYELYRYIKDLKKEKPDYLQDDLFLKASYLFLSRLLNPFMIFTLCLLGCFFGINEQRHSKNHSYIQTIAAVMASFLILAFFRGMAENGYLHPVLASFIPQVFLIFVAGSLIRYRSRRPVGS